MGDMKGISAVKKCFNDHKRFSLRETSKLAVTADKKA